MQSQTETLWFVTARTCNLACSYCYQGAENHARDYLAPRGLVSIMPKSVADRALPWAIDWTTKELGVQFYGGEPLLAWPLIRAVVPEWKAAFAEAGKAVKFGITTNGTLLKPEVRDFMDEHDVGMLLSLDGPQWSHDQSRPAKGEASSWELIDPESVLAWRPELEVAWCLAPHGYWGPGSLDDLIALGFRKVNFNLDSTSNWSLEEQARLQAFGQHVGRLVARGELGTNWARKYMMAGTSDQRMGLCGLATQMLALTPEGDIYPSQEMAFTVYENRAPGTPEYYRIGNVANDPVIDPVARARVSLLSVEDMKPKPEFRCDDCVARTACIGGCHCRYVGQDGVNPAQRTDVPAGLCQSFRSFLTGMIAGAWVERKLRPPTQESTGRHCKPHAGVPAQKPRQPNPEPFPETAELIIGGSKWRGTLLSP